jgi:hypothetical protein
MTDCTHCSANKGANYFGFEVGKLSMRTSPGIAAGGVSFLPVSFGPPERAGLLVRYSESSVHSDNPIPYKGYLFDDVLHV